MYLSVELVTARTCYKHLAGSLGIAIRDSLIRNGYVIFSSISDDSAHFEFSCKGAPWCKHIGMVIQTPIYLKACMDHSHQQWHISGAWAVQFCAFLFENGYLERGLHKRSIHVTENGKNFFQRELGLNELESRYA